MKKYEFEELLDLSYGEYPWWTARAKDSERMFHTAVHHQMMCIMCLDNRYHPDYAGGVIDNTVYKYYERAYRKVKYLSTLVGEWKKNEE